MTRNKGGRPPLYTRELAEHVCEVIAGGFPLHRFDERDDLPGKTTVARWLAENSEFRERYARAREELADRYAAEVVSIADEANPAAMHGIEHARTRIDARKWASAKAAPKKYGDKQQIDLTGKLTLEQLVEASIKP